MNSNSNNNTNEEPPTRELTFDEYILSQHGAARARAIIWAWNILNDIEEIPFVRPQIQFEQRNFNFRISINRMESIIRKKFNEEKEI